MPKPKRPPNSVRFKLGGFTIEMSTRYKGYCEDGCILGWGHLSQCVVDNNTKKRK